MLLYSFRVILSASVLVALLLCTAVWIWRHEMTTEMQYAFYFGAATLPIMAALNTCRSVLRGFRRIALAQTGELIIRPVLLVISVLAFVFIADSGPRGSTATGMNGFAFLLAACCSIYWLRGTFATQAREAKPVFYPKEWFSIAFPLLLLSGISILLNQTDKVMLGFLSGAEGVGVYSIAHRITTLISFGLLAVNAIAGPMISRLFATNERQELQRILGLSAAGALAIAIPVTILILAAGRHILLLFGQSFSSAYDALWILSAGQFVNVLAGSVMLVMTMTGHQKPAFYLMGGCAILNIIFNFFLMPHYGVNGAAAATSISMALWNVLTLIYVWRNLHLDSTIFALFRSRNQ
jgi:O-antigen/teichoic acid export membrane protein